MSDGENNVDSGSPEHPGTVTTGTYVESPAVASPADASSASLSATSAGAGSVQPLLGKSEADLAAVNDVADMLKHAAACNRMQRARIAEDLGWSRSKLERKLKDFERRGVAGLLRKRRRDRGRARVADAQVIARIKTGFLQTYRPSAASIYKEVARDYEMSGLKAPSYSFVLRTTKKIDPDLLAHARVGAREFDDKHAIVTLRRKPALPRLWCDADHHLIDHVVIFADGTIGRPWLTAIQDICTNEITGYVLSREKKTTYPGSAAIGLCLRTAILKKPVGADLCVRPSEQGAHAGAPLHSTTAWPSFGLFDNFYSDLGKDFRSQYVRAVCHDLAIKVVYTRGYHGKSKPIERWLGTLEAGIKHLPGYVGRNTETNPLAQTIGARPEWESLRQDIMTIDQFSAVLHDWIVNIFHHAESRALRGYSPIGLLEKHIADGWVAREVTNERALDLLMMSRAGKTVQRMGIQMFSTQYQQRFFLAPELAAMVGQEVQVFWDPANIGEIVVYKDNRFVCMAQNRQLLDFGHTSVEDLTRERALIKAQKDSVRERHQQLLIEAQYPNEMERVQAEKRLGALEETEREKIAVNATAGSVPVLLPKFAAAARQLKIQNSKLKMAGSLTTKVTKGTKVGEMEELKSSEDLFAAEDYDAGDELKSSEELFGEDN